MCSNEGPPLKKKEQLTRRNMVMGMEKRCITTRWMVAMCY